jgi:hypothetical protein
MAKHIPPPTAQKVPAVFFLSLLLIAVVFIFFLSDDACMFILSKNVQLTISFPYVGLALAGVLYHLMHKYREYRDTTGFKWDKYKFDYVLRAFEAPLFVIIIENGFNPDNNGLESFGLGLLALFVGMYVRKVEEAFDKFGARFGSMVHGLLGTGGPISPEEQSRIADRFHELRRRYDEVEDRLDQEDRKEIVSFLAQGKEAMIERRYAVVRTINADIAFLLGFADADVSQGSADQKNGDRDEPGETEEPKS